MDARLGLTLGLLTATFFTGCSSEPEPRPLGSDAFYRRDDRGGAIQPGPRVPQTPSDQPSGKVTDAPAENTAATPSADALQFVTKQVKSTTPGTQPAESPKQSARPVTYEVGQYVSVGAIIAEVNGTPIYADNVVRAIAPLLAARAKDLDEQPFRNLASSEINRQVEDMIRAEVAYAAADRNTSAEDKTTADRITQQWRDRLKTENKGSMEEVRRKFRDQGTTYDDAAKEEYRRNLVRVYYTKKLFPRIQVTADDLRRYYDKNRDALFTQHDTLTFRLIKISPDSMGSDALAQKKADELAARISRGEDFATIAGEINHDPNLLRNKGLTGPIDRGAYRLESIENALWQLHPGEATPVMKADGAYYLAKLETKTNGRTQAFEENAVQGRMLETLRSDQFAKMRRDMESQLQKDSVVNRNAPTYATALEMAMQGYPKWHN
ncbi:MAG: peptidylprolyl cis-trans isomerase, PpiC-type [Phycisphaerales bacterium]|nr:peptidylprolyl cis-trans isomerase, PpiC-type [Phycisphaerales bacterium]